MKNLKKVLDKVDVPIQILSFLNSISKVLFIKLKKEIKQYYSKALVFLLEQSCLVKYLYFQSMFPPFPTCTRFDLLYQSEI